MPKKIDLKAISAGLKKQPQETTTSPAAVGEPALPEPPLPDKVTKNRYRRTIYLNEQELAGLIKLQYNTRRNISDLCREAIRKYLGLDD